MATNLLKKEWTLNARKSGIMTLSIMTLSIMTLGIMTLSQSHSA